MSKISKMQILKKGLIKITDCLRITIFFLKFSLLFRNQAQLVRQSFLLFPKSQSFHIVSNIGQGYFCRCTLQPNGSYKKSHMFFLNRKHIPIPILGVYSRFFPVPVTDTGGYRFSFGLLAMKAKDKSVESPNFHKLDTSSNPHFMDILVKSKFG